MYGTRNGATAWNKRKIEIWHHHNISHKKAKAIEDQHKVVISSGDFLKTSEARESIGQRHTAQTYIFSNMMSFASRSATATDGNGGLLCDVGEAASNTTTVFRGGNTETTTRRNIRSSPPSSPVQKLRSSITKTFKSSPPSSPAQKLRSSITKNSSFGKLASKISTKSKSKQQTSISTESKPKQQPSKPQGQSDLQRPATASTAALPSSAPGGNLYLSAHSNGSSLQPSLASEVGKSAHEYLEECLVTEVSILDRDKFNAVPEYQKNQLNVVKHLGKGSYSDVFEVVLNISIFDEKNGDSTSIDDIIIERLGDLSLSTTGPSPPIHKKKQGVNTNTEEARDDISSRRRPPRARRVTFTSSVQHPMTRPNRCGERQVVYAMKCLRPQIRSDAEQFIIGAEDLVHETALLATLDHPNIIKVHGRSAGQVKDAFTLNDGYFILLDRLKKETLQDYIGDWSRYLRHQGPTVRQIDIAISIAEAVTYLHSKKIAYRDLKPGNIGFDSQGVVKLFDFGFAIGLPAENYLDVSNPYGLLFDKCGTPRYMAPEVGLELGYRTEVDDYSYGILLWEICALTKPFAEIKTADEFERAVFIQGVRPSVKEHWPVLLSDTMKKCWSTRPGMRPSIKSVGSILREVKASLSGGGGDGSIPREVKASLSGGEVGGEKRRPPRPRATRRLSLNMGHGHGYKFE
eukprot:scaffold7523_cov124-Skeletonema_marinoi.AAC.2